MPASVGVSLVRHAREDAIVYLRPAITQRTHQWGKGAPVCNRRLLIALTTGVWLIPGGLARGQCEIEQLVPRGASGSGLFGSAVAVSSDGNRVAVSATSEFYVVPGDRAGAVYVFEAAAGWTQQAELRASDAAEDDFFGSSVAMTSDGNLLIIGASGVDHEGVPNAGAVYVFAWDGNAWVEQAKLTVPTAEFDDKLGGSVGVSADGTTLIASASNVGESMGLVYVFGLTGETWDVEATLIASNSAPGDQFGTAVALASDGNTALISARRAQNYTGAAYVFTRQGKTWNQQAELNASDGEIGDQLGYAVALSPDGTVALLGTPNDSDQEFFGGSVYVFERSGEVWTEQQKLTASDSAEWDQFGEGVALSGDGTTAVIGASGDTEGGDDAGSAYVFARTGGIWQEQYKIKASDAAPNRDFGLAIAMATDGDAVIIGARGSSNIPVAGAAYVYRAGGPDCNQNGVADSCDITSTIHTYRLDDGEAEESIGVTGGGYMIWLNQFTVYPGAEVIDSIDLAWGQVPVGLPTMVVVWADPNNDGNPIDAQLLTQAGPVHASNPGTGIFTTVPIPPTIVGNAGDSYFVGALAPHVIGDAPAALDEDEPQGRSWVASGNNLDNLGANKLFGTIDSFGFPGNWLIRASDTPDPTSQDQDGNGVPDECPPGDLDGDGTIGILDFLSLLAAWGPCPAPCPPSCVADLDGDCDVGITDFLLLLANWTP